MIWVQGVALGAGCMFQWLKTRNLPSSGSGWGCDEFMWVKCFEDELSAYLSTHSLAIKSVNIITHISRSAIFLSLNGVGGGGEIRNSHTPSFGNEGLHWLRCTLMPMKFGLKTKRIELGAKEWLFKILRLLEKEMATHSSILAWKNPWTEESGGLKFRGLHDWACVHEVEGDGLVAINW